VELTRKGNRKMVWWSRRKMWRGWKLKRECPVPKPGGIVGEILGFKSSTGEKGNKPP